MSEHLAKEIAEYVLSNTSEHYELMWVNNGHPDWDDEIDIPTLAREYLALREAAQTVVDDCWGEMNEAERVVDASDIDRLRQALSVE